VSDWALCRHAESAWHAAGRWQGHGDPPLSARGREQAAALAAELLPLRFELVVTSDLGRAAETGAALARAFGVERLGCPGLRELDLGRWTGLTRPEIAARDPEALARFEAGDVAAPAGGAETRNDLARRAGATLAALRARHPGERLAVVTHLGIIRALLREDLEHAQWRWLPSAPPP
jgi:probable phosphoglycerate mutase